MAPRVSQEVLRCGVVGGGMGIVKVEEMGKWEWLGNITILKT